MTTNTLTNLIPDAYAALDVVSRELAGLIPAVTIDASVNAAALNQSVFVPVAPTSNTATSITPAMSVPAEADQTIGSVEIKIDQQYAVPFSWSGSEQDGVNKGAGYLTIRQNQIAQAMRTLVNKIELELASLYIYASRAYGTAGAAPFGTAGDYMDAAMVRKILIDNGAPSNDLQLVVNTAAGANLRGKQGGRGVNYEGSQDLLRRGVLLDIHGFMVRESAQVVSHTKGAGTGYDFASGGEAIGQTTLSVEGGTANTTGIKAGDVITHAGDTATHGSLISGKNAPHRLPNRRHKL